MATTVVVIAQGEMGAGIGQRLRVARRARPHLARGTQRGERRARGQRPAWKRSNDDARLVAEADFLLSVIPPGEAVPLRAPLRAASRGQREEAGLRRMQRHQRGARQGSGGDHRAHRRALRRWRHRRRARPRPRRRAGASMSRAPDAARALRLQRVWPRHPPGRGRRRRGVGGQMLLCRAHQGDAGAGRGADPRRDARRRGAGGAQGDLATSQPRSVRPISRARSPTCTARPIAGSRRWRRSATISASPSPARARSIAAWRGSTSIWREDADRRARRIPRTLSASRHALSRRRRYRRHLHRLRRDRRRRARSPPPSRPRRPTISRAA